MRRLQQGTGALLRGLRLVATGLCWIASLLAFSLLLRNVLAPGPSPQKEPANEVSYCTCEDYLGGGVIGGGVPRGMGCAPCPCGQED